MDYYYTDRRREQRYSIPLPVDIFGLDDINPKGRGQVLSISASGMSLTTPLTISIGQSFRIGFISDEFPIWKKIEIVGVAKGDESFTYRSVFVDELKKDDLLDQFLRKLSAGIDASNRRKKSVSNFGPKDSPAPSHQNKDRITAALKSMVSSFERLAKEGARTPSQLRHKTIALIHEICGCIEICERIGLNKKDVLTLIEPIRNVCAKSQFIRRLQEWPRGYCGDFETIEYLISQRNKSKEGTIEFYLEEYALGSMLAQQHRNKIRTQADTLLKTILAYNQSEATTERSTHEHSATPNILSIACGSSFDIDLIKEFIRPLPFKLLLNDMDAGAIALSKKKLMQLSNKIEYVQGNVFTCLSKLKKKGPFDLVICGGLFDYLNDRQAILLIKKIMTSIKPNGTFIFTNLANYNPYRYWMEYFVDWSLFERAEENILELTDLAGIKRQNVKIERDSTGLTLFTELSVGVLSRDQIYLNGSVANGENKIKWASKV